MNLETLKKLALAATPGPWHYDCQDYIWKLDEARNYDGMIAELRGVGRGLPLDANGEFIAAANPAVIMKLIEALEVAENELMYLSGSDPRASVSSAGLDAFDHLKCECKCGTKEINTEFLYSRVNKARAEIARLLEEGKC